MKNIVILWGLLLVLNSNVFSANEPGEGGTDANVFGHVINAETGEHIPFINILIEGTRIGTITDASGHYLLTNLPEGKHRLVVQGMGFKTTYKDIEAIASRTIEVDVKIMPSRIDLDVVVLTASPTRSAFRYRPDQVFTGEGLQSRGEASFGEILNGEPGVAMRSLGSAPARPVIRGMDGDRILVLQNGERMGDVSEMSADHSISLDPLSASRIEVIRGPASLLYGSSALGGVINIMTTDIPEFWDLGHSGVVSLQGATVNEMMAGFGRYTYGTENMAATARFSYRQAGDINTPKGIVRNTSMTNYDGAIGTGFIGDLLSGGLNASFTSQTFEIPETMDEDEKVEIRMERQGLQGNFYRNRDGLFDKSQMRFNISRMYQEEIEMELEEDGSWDEDVELSFEKYTLSSTYTIQHKPVGIVDRGAIGLNLYAHNTDVGGDEAYIPGERRVTFAVFTFQEVPLSNKLRIQTGIRFDYQYSKALPNHIFPDINSSCNAFNYSGSLGMNFRPAQGWEIGGQFARSHRNPSVVELYANGPHLGAGVFEVGSKELKDEIGHGGDLFVNYRKNRLHIEVAGYINHFLNYIIFEGTGEIDSLSGYPIFHYQGDEARLMGGEVSLKYNLTDKFTLQMATDYVHGKRTGNGNDYLPFIPPLRYKADLKYDFGSFWLGMNAQIVDTQKRVAPEEEVTKGYTLLGFQAGYRLDKAGGHVFIIRGDNLLDQAYRDHLSRIEDRNILMPGRNINLSYRWFF